VPAWFEQALDGGEKPWSPSGRAPLTRWANSPLRALFDLLKRFNLIWPVQPCFRKYFAFPLTQIKSKTLAVLSPEGRLAIVTNAGWDAVDAAASGAWRERRAGHPLREPRERSNGARTNGDSCGRQSRVVLAPVAGVKLAEVKSARPGSISL
jgi:hypothetical protein